MDWQQYSGVDWTQERRASDPYRVPKRYRKYNRKLRAAQAERKQRYREHNEKRRREYGSRTQKVQ